MIGTQNITKRASLLLGALMWCVLVYAQAPASLSPVLIGSTGNFSATTNLSISSSVGEPMVPTFSASPFVLTQGFQQPRSGSLLALDATVIYSDVSCTGAGDGTAYVNPTGGSAPYEYVWSSAQGDTFQSVDSLAPGTYSVTVTDAGGLSITQTFVIVEGGELCGIHIYSGFTPNGDNHNDLWLIDYVELYPSNSMSIYNRWGQLVWSGVNYDNNSVVWNGNDNSGNPLPGATYFYVFTVEGKSPMKNWVELTR